MAISEEMDQKLDRTPVVAGRPERADDRRQDKLVLADGGERDEHAIAGQWRARLAHRSQGKASLCRHHRDRSASARALPGGEANRRSSPAQFFGRQSRSGDRASHREARSQMHRSLPRRIRHPIACCLLPLDARMANMIQTGTATVKRGANDRRALHPGRDVVNVHGTSEDAPVAQRIERLPPEQEATGSSPVGRTSNE